MTWVVGLILKYLEFVLVFLLTNQKILLKKYLGGVTLLLVE